MCCSSTPFFLNAHIVFTDTASLFCLLVQVAIVLSLIKYVIELIMSPVHLRGPEKCFVSRYYKTKMSHELLVRVRKSTNGVREGSLFFCFFCMNLSDECGLI